MKTKMTKEQKEKEKINAKRRKAILEKDITLGALIQLDKTGIIHVSTAVEKEGTHRKHEVLGLLESAKIDIMFSK